jgi:hypothetical protein
MNKARAPGDFAVIKDGTAWRVSRTSDGAWVGREDGPAHRNPPILRGWGTERAAAEFVGRLVQGAPIAVMHLAWIVPTSPQLADSV